MLGQQGLCFDSAVRRSDRATVSGNRTFLCRHGLYLAASLTIAVILTMPSTSWPAKSG